MTPDTKTPSREEPIDDLTILAICEEVLRHESDTAETVLAKWARSRLQAEAGSALPVGRPSREQIANIIDPAAWTSQTQYDAKLDAWHESLRKADAVLKLFEGRPSLPQEIEARGDTPWEVRPYAGGAFIIGAGDETIAARLDSKIAAYIVACVNKCAGGKNAS